MRLILTLVLLLASFCAEAAPATQATTRPSTRPFTVVCFGDSITGNRPREAYRHQYLKYADVLESMLVARLGDGRAVVLNRGFAGDKSYPDPQTQTPGGSARVAADVVDERPDVAVILIGGNDKKQTDADRQRSEEHLGRILSACKAAGIRTLVLQYHCLPNPRQPAKAWIHLTGNNALLTQFAARMEMPTLDMAAVMENALASTPLAELVNLVDGVHLAPGGELVYARAIFARISELGWLPEKSSGSTRTGS